MASPDLSALNLLSPVWTYSAVLGVAPHVLDAPGVHRRIPIVASSISLVFHAVLFGVVILDCVLWSHGKRIIDTCFSTFMWTVSIIAPCSFIIRALLSNKKKIEDLWGVIYEANLILDIDRPLDLKKLRRKVVIQLVMVTLIILFNIFTGIFTWKMPFWSIIIHCFTYLQNILVLLQFQQLVAIINQKCLGINQILESISLKKFSVSKSKSLASCFILFDSETQGSSQKVRKNLVDEQVEKIKAIKTVHFLLTKACKYVNDIYGFHIACYMSFTVVFTTCSLYFMIVAVWFQFWNNIIWPCTVLSVCITYSFTTTLIVILLCQHSVNIIDTMKSCLAELLLSQSNPKLTREVKYFLWQMSSCTIKFDAGGFFNIDYKLLTTFLSTICAYLVIAIQFIPSNNPKEN